MILCDFLKDSQAWVLNEEQKIVETGGRIPAILLDIFGSTAASFGEVVTERQSSFDLLNASKLEVISELNSDPGYIVSLVTSRQADLVEAIASDVDQLGTYMTDLTNGVNNPPAKVENKTAIRETIEDVQQVLKQTLGEQGALGAPGDPLQGLVDDGIISQDELDAYTNQNPVKRTRTTIKTVQVVRELRDRYYKIDPSGEDRVIFDENTSGVDVVDSDGGVVEDFFGYPDTQLTPNGDIVLTGENGTQEVLSLRPITKNKSPNPGRTTKRTTFDLKKDDIKEEFAYETWACALFRMVEAIQNLVESIADKVDDFLAVADVSNRLLNQTPLGTAFEFTSTVLGDLYSLGNIEEIEIGDRVLELVGVSRSLSLGAVSPGSNSTRAICDANKAVYCEAAFGFDKVFDFLSAQLDSLDLTGLGFDLGGLGGIVLQAFEAIINISKELQGYVDELRQEVRKLFGDICAFIDRGIRGTPKSSQKINDVLSAISVALALAPGAILAGINNSVRIGKIIIRLARAGYDAASRALANGQIQKFLSMKTDDAIFAARAAICLEEASANTDNLTLSAKMARLSNAARTSADRQSTSQRINEGMHQRFLQRSTGAEIAKIVRDEGWKSIQETRLND